MSIQVVLFDLDGTLLPMDQDEFVKSYFGLLAKKLAPYGYEAEKLVPAIWQGTGAMIKNDGTRKNEEAFWHTFSGIFGEQVIEDLPLFDEFYRVEFSGAKEACGFNPKASEVISFLKEKQMRFALATNPIFPAVATENRIRWAGLKPEDFEFYTTYETCRYCKPNPKYYEETDEYIIDTSLMLVIDKSLKNIDYTKENCIRDILNKTQNILDIDNIKPVELSIIYEYLFNKYCPNYNVKINNLYLNNQEKNHFIMISYNNDHYSYNYKEKSFIKVNDNDLIDNLTKGKIGLYLNEFIPNIKINLNV